MIEPRRDGYRHGRLVNPSVGSGQFLVRTDSGEIIQVTDQKLGLKWDIDSSIDLSVGV